MIDDWTKYTDGRYTFEIRTLNFGQGRLTMEIFKNKGKGNDNAIVIIRTINHYSF